MWLVLIRVTFTVMRRGPQAILSGSFSRDRSLRLHVHTRLAGRGQERLRQGGGHGHEREDPGDQARTSFHGPFRWIGFRSYRQPSGMFQAAGRMCP